VKLIFFWINSYFKIGFSRNMSINYQRLSLLTHFSSEMGCAVMRKNGNFTLIKKFFCLILVIVLTRFT